MPFHKGISNNYHLSQDNETFQIITNFKYFIGNLILEIRNWKFQLGFSLIELMIVVSLFGVAASLVTASYLNFERNHGVKSAASTLKNELRLVQNKAATGDKGPHGSVCNPTGTTTTLGGWYLRIQSGAAQTSYSIGGVCLAPVTFAETSFGRRTITLPRDLIVNKITYTPVADPPGQTLPMVIFFRPLSSQVFFLNAASALPNETAPDFFDNSGVFFANKTINPPPASTVKIELADATLARKYQVAIESTGEVNEVKP